MYHKSGAGAEVLFHISPLLPNLKLREGIDDAVGAGGLEGRAGVGGRDGDDAHAGGVRGLNTGDGVFKNGTSGWGDAEERSRAEVAVGRGLRVAVLGRVHHTAEVAAEVEPVEDEVDVLLRRAGGHTAGDAVGVRTIEERAKAVRDAQMGSVELAVDRFLFVFEGGQFVIRDGTPQQAFHVHPVGRAHPFKDLLVRQPEAMSFRKEAPGQHMVAAIVRQHAVHVKNICLFTHGQ